MRNYKIDTDAIGDYIRELKRFQKDFDTKRREIRKKTENAHSFWDDDNYDLTIKAMDEIDSVLEELENSMEVTISSLSEMKRKYDNYLTRRSH